MNESIQLNEVIARREDFQSIELFIMCFFFCVFFVVICFWGEKGTGLLPVPDEVMTMPIE